MEEHCKWIVHGSDGLGGKGRTRMRSEVAAARRHLLALGRAFRITGFMAHFVIWRAVLCQTGLFERGQIQARRYLGGSPGPEGPKAQAGSASGCECLGLVTLTEAHGVVGTSKYFNSQDY